MGFHDIVLDADIIFLIFKICKLQYQEIKHFFDRLKSTLKWRLLISSEVENEIEDPFSLPLTERLIKDSVLERFQSSNKKELREIAQTYNDLRKTMGKGEASCYAIANVRDIPCCLMIMKHSAPSLLKLRERSSGFLFMK